MIPDRLDRHVALEVLRASLLVGAVFLALDWLLAFLDQIDDRRGAYGLVAIAEFIALTSPRRLWDMVPYIALLGALVGLSVLGGRGELVVMRAAGRRLERITGAALLAAVLIVGAGALLGEVLGPGAEAQAQLRKAQARQDGPLRSRGGSWHQDGELLTHAGGVDPAGGLTDITQYRFGRDGTLQELRTAAAAQPLPGPDPGGSGAPGVWRLTDVRVLAFGPERIERSEHAAMDWHSDANARQFRLDLLVAPQRMAIGDLRERIATLDARGENADRWRLAFWQKLAQPLAVMALVLVGAAFVFGPLRERGMGTRLMAGIGAGLLFRYSQDLLAPASLVFGFPPLIAVLLPVLTAAGVGLLLLRRAG